MSLSQIADVVSGVPLMTVFKIEKAIVDKILRLSPEKRLLWIIHAQFGDETGLSRKEFTAWLDDDEAQDVIAGIVHGNLAGKDGTKATREMIESRLVNTDAVDRGAIAQEMAEGMLMLAPWVLNTPMEGTAQVSKKADLILAAIEDKQGADPASAAAALVGGPLAQAGMETKARKAQQLAEDSPVEAAETFMEVGAGLRAVGLDIVAETYLELAGELFAKGGDERAIDARSAVAERQVRRGTDSATIAISRLRDALPPERQWEADALEARLDFGAGWEDAIDTLREASVHAAGGERELWHLANYLDLLALAGKHDIVLNASEAAVTSKPEGESSLMIQLDRLDALRELGRDEAESGWRDLLAHLDLDGDSVAAGIAWQRRGSTLARAGEVDRCHEAYRRAMTHFAAVPGFEEQTADGLYSIHAASIVNATNPPDTNLRALAYEQRGSPRAPVATASALSRRGMDRRIAGQMPDALRAYSQALAHHRRAGSLQGFLETSEKLGELLASVGEHAAAVGCFIAGGQSTQAANAATQASPAQLADRLNISGPRWERSASYEVLAMVGSRMPEAYLTEIGPALIAEAEGEPDAWAAPQPVFHARVALAEIVLALQPDQRELTWPILEAELGSHWMNMGRVSSRALEQATVLGLTDGSKPLAEAFVADPHNSYVTLGWLADRAKENDEIREMLTASAAEGNPALAVLSIADLVAGDAGLQAAADAAAERLSTATNVEHTDGGISIGFGHSYEIDGLAAECASEELRIKAVRRLREIANDPEDAENNRSSAANALFNLASVIPKSEAAATIAALLPLAKGDYALSESDHNNDHPLSRFRFTIHTPEVLWEAALGAIARILAVYADLDRDGLQDAIGIAIERGSERVVAAAADSLARLPEIEMPVSAELLMRHPDKFVRSAGLGCWGERHDRLPTGELLESLRTDPATGVRHRLTVMAADADDLDLLERIASEDEQAMIRRLAEMRLREARTRGLGPTTCPKALH